MKLTPDTPQNTRLQFGVRLDDADKLKANAKACYHGALWNSMDNEIEGSYIQKFNEMDEDRISISAYSVGQNGVIGEVLVDGKRFGAPIPKEGLMNDQNSWFKLLSRMLGRSQEAFRQLHGLDVQTPGQPWSVSVASAGESETAQPALTGAAKKQG